MPTPNEGESKQDFIDRCMGDSEAVEDFPEADQRFAFCNSVFEEEGGRSMDESLQSIDGTIYRDATITPEAIVDEEERLVRISFSSEKPVLRASWFENPWVEVLGHDEGEVNLSRLQNGATVHYNHSRSRADRVGVVEQAGLSKNRGEALIRFSKSDRVNDIWEDVRDGILRNVSVGYSIDQRKLVVEGGKGEPDEYRVTRWTPMEISFVDVPADHTVGVGREEGAVDMRRTANYLIQSIQEDSEMDDDESTNSNSNQNPDDGSQQRQQQRPPDNTVQLDVARDEGVAEGRRLETERRTQITDLVTPFERQLGDGFVTFRDGLLSGSDSVEDVRALLLKELGKESAPVGGDSVRVTETATEKFRDAASVALCLRGDLIPADQKEAQRVIAAGVRGYTLPEMARHMLELEGVETGKLSRLDLIGRAFTSSDFPLILVDAANKAMLKGFEEAPETWQIWAQTGDLSDFKIGRRVGLSSFDDLELVSENGEFHYGAFTEQGETIQLATFGKLFAISRQAIINDDLSAFTVIPSRMGRSASRLVGDLAYGVITSNPVMGDGLAFFSGTSVGVDHGNLNINGAAALTVVSVGGARNAMALQSDASNSATGLNIRPSFLLVPLALEDTAKVLMSSERDPAEGTTTSFFAPNAVRNLAEVVSDPRLDADSVTRWYLAASQQFDTIEVAFLDGVQAPLLEQQMGWNVDGTEFKVRIDVGTAPMEFRTWQRNDGV